MGVERHCSCRILNRLFMGNSITDNNDCANQNAASQPCIIDSKGDPLDNLDIRREEYSPKDNLFGNLFIGYYGKQRIGKEQVSYKVNGKNKKETIYVTRRHTGYDYLAKEGTDVKAVGNGEIVRVRFGKIGGIGNISCPFKLDLYSKVVQEEIAKMQEKLLYPLKSNNFDLTSFTYKNESELAIEMVNSMIRDRFLEQKENIVKKKKEKLLELNIEENTTRAKVKEEELQKLKEDVGATKEDVKKNEEELDLLKEELAEQVHTGEKINSRYSGIISCKQCSQKSGCFGVQVWLKLKDNKYAYYAHLSDLSDKILSKLLECVMLKLSEYYVLSQKERNKILFPKHKDNSLFEDNSLFFGQQYLELFWTSGSFSNTFDFDVPIGVQVGTIIGKSGCTGNAYNMKIEEEHLHFECRKSGKKDEIPETGTQISPNSIVKTKFYIVKDSDQGKKNGIIEEITVGEETIEEITKEKVGITEKDIEKKQFDWSSRQRKEWKKYEIEIWNKEKGSEASKMNNWKKHIESVKETQWNEFKNGWSKISEDEYAYLKDLLFTGQDKEYAKKECLLIEKGLFVDKYSTFKQQHCIKKQSSTFSCKGGITPTVIK